MAFSVTEKSSARYSAVLTDEDNAAVGLSALTSLRLWLRDVATGTYINSREGQNVLNANDVSFSVSGGNLIWELTPEDNIIVGDATTEEHEAVFYAVWDDGGNTRAKSWSVAINVTNYVPIDADT